MLLALVVNGRWRPGIGDPTVIGWLTVIAYFAAAFGCTSAAVRTSSPKRKWREQSALFWTVLAILMVVLGINKQLDLQSLLTVIGRSLFQSLGLYGERRHYQVAFIEAIALLCVGLVVTFLWFSRHMLRERWLAITGMVFILGFVMIRASSFHNVDLFIGSQIGGLKWNWILELGGIGFICLASLRVVPPVSPPASRNDGHLVYHYRIRR